MKPEYLILVDEHDNEIDICEKIQAHKIGALHRAVSVLIFNSKNELLVQKRATSKYHSPALWSNTCCTHPKPGEDTLTASKRRLFEEMRISTELNHAFSFIYKVLLDNMLTEHEFDHVFIGFTDDVPKPDINEVCDWRYFSLSELETKLADTPTIFTAWFSIIFEQLIRYQNNDKQWQPL